jgi:hypothetical protein
MSSSKITRKLNLQLVLNIEIFPTPIKMELGVLDVARKLMNYVLHL